MKDYEVGITGAGGVPDRPKVKPQDGKVEAEKADVQEKLTAEVTGKAKAVAQAAFGGAAAGAVGAAIDTAAIMGFVRALPEIQRELSPEYTVPYPGEDKVATDVNIEYEKAKAKLQEQVKKEFAPSFVEGYDPAVGDIKEVPSSKVCDKPESADGNMSRPINNKVHDSIKKEDKDEFYYYDQFIKENGGERLTKKQIKEKYHELKKEFDKAEQMNNGRLSEEQIRDFEMKRHVLKGMMRGETFERPVVEPDEEQPPKIPTTEAIADCAPTTPPEERPEPLPPETLPVESRLMKGESSQMAKPEFEETEAEVDVQEPSVYYNQYIEENGGEPLTKKQIREHIREINRTLSDPETIMTEIEYHEFQMKRDVLIDMLHGVTY